MGRKKKFEKANIIRIASKVNKEIKDNLIKKGEIEKKSISCCIRNILTKFFNNNKKNKNGK